jgi:hypothetical protein
VRALRRRHEPLALLVLVALGALLLGRRPTLPSLEFDEQVYLASADLLVRGMTLGRDVFTSQPPLFLAFLDGAGTLLGGDAALLRVPFVALTLAGALASWAIVRRHAGTLPGLVAAALVIVAPGVVEAAAVVSADVPSVALGTLALLAAHAAHARPAWGAAAGALLACALMTKLLAAPFVVAIAAGAIADRPSRRAVAWFVMGALAVVVPVLLAYADVLAELWHGAVGMHLEAREAHVRFPRPSILVTALLVCAAYAGLLAVLAAGLLETPRGQLRAWLAWRADLLALLAAGIGLCAVQRPLLAHHLVIVAWPLALLAASALPRALRSGRAWALVALGVVLAVPWTIHGRDTVPPAERAVLADAAAEIAARTAPRDAVVCDLPSVALLAGRPAHPVTVDPSYVRVATGALRPAAIEAAAAQAGAACVGRAFRDVPGLRAALDRRFARRHRFGTIDVWTEPRRM